MGKYTLDLATLQIFNKCNYSVIVKIQSLWCYKCEPYLVTKIKNLGNSTIHLDTTHESLITTEYDKINNDYANCQKTYHFGDHGNYEMDIWSYSEKILDLVAYVKVITCDIVVKKDPINSNLPILWFFLIALPIMLLWNLRGRMIAKLRGWPRSMQIFPNSPHHTHLSTTHSNTITEDSYVAPSIADDPMLPTLTDAPHTPVVDPTRDKESRDLVLPTRSFQNFGGQLETSTLDATNDEVDRNYVPVTTQVGNRGGMRLIFLDTFRGLSVMLMIFFNYGGGKYWFFQHSPWNGLTYADIVFPFFVFTMGFTFIISFRKKIGRGTSKRTLFWDITRRSVLLFTIGFILSNMNGDKLSQFRIMGVLQRLALVYFILATMFLLTTLPSNRYILCWKMSTFIEIISVFVLCLVQIPYFIGKAPGCPGGYNGPGGISLNSTYPNCTGGIYAYIDRIILGPNHMYQNPTCKKLYHTTVPFDPEGIMGTFSATLLAYLGTRAATRFVTNYATKNYLTIVLDWLGSFVIMGLLAGGLCSFTSETGWIPINKNLWSLSYTLATAALSNLALTICFVLIDLTKLWDGLPFYFVGMNPLLIYIGHEIFRNYFPFNLHLSHKFMNDHTYLFMQDVWSCLLWMFIAYLLYKKKLFVSL